MRFLPASMLPLLCLVAVPSAAAQSNRSASPSAQTAGPDSTAAEASDDEPWDRTTYADTHTDDYVGANHGWTHPHERESPLYRTAPPSATIE